MAFELGRRLGSGTFGEVFEGKMGNQEFAIKYINYDAFGIREVSEINMLKKFNHPNILKSLDMLWVEETRIGISLPLARFDLRNAITRTTPPELLKHRWIYQLLSGVNFIHKNGYYHCDIKPANVLIINDAAVISDPGLMDLQIVASMTCQTICSPQLLYKRYPEFSHLMDNPIYKESITNNVQTDLWALGETIYFIENKKYAIFNDINDMNKYLSTRELPGKESVFNPIIKTLLNPHPSQLNINLTALLGHNPFAGVYRDYITGTINSDIPNEYPVIFRNPSLVKLFSSTISWILKECDRFRMRKLVVYNTIDMFYRIHFIIPNDSQFKLFMTACMTLSAKLYREDIFKLDLLEVDTEQLLATEKLIVMVLKGILDRDSLIFYPVSFDKFKMWIVEYPERYEQFNMAGLVRQIHEYKPKLLLDKALTDSM